MKDTVKTVDRREFLGGLSLAAATLSLGGCASGRMKLGSPGSMSGFRMKPIEDLRVGIVGVGSRGSAAVGRLAVMPGTRITAVCDLVPERAAKAAQTVVDLGFARPKEYVGDEGWKALCDAADVDVVYNAASYDAHLPVCVRAMTNGKPAFVEVPGSLYLDDCWEYVETCERTRVPCMMLENCCYGRDELLLMRLALTGRLGTVVHGEGGYIHDGRWYMYPEKDTDEMPWWLRVKIGHNGNAYPMHGLGPVALAMNVNRGDRFDYLTSVGSRSVGMQEHAQRRFGVESRYGRLSVGCNDINTTIVKTVKGNTFMLQINTATPRPYSRMNLLVGSRGTAGTYPLRVAIEKENGKGANWLGADDLAAFEKAEMHPLWRVAGEAAALAGGHGGMDFVMDLRWTYCLRHGLPLDMDVYDLASWSAICELSERSCDLRGEPVEIPDFTRGAWKTNPPVGIWSFGDEPLGLDMDKVARVQSRRK